MTQLREVLGGGVVDSPIATSLDLNRMSAGSPVERGIADILSTLEEVAQAQRQGFDRVRRLTARPANGGRALEDLVRRLDELEEYALTLDDPSLQHQISKVMSPARYLYRESGGLSAQERRYRDSARLRMTADAEEMERAYSAQRKLDESVERSDPEQSTTR